MSPIIRWELRQRRTYFLAWVVAGLAFIVLLLLLYPSIHREAGQLNKVINQLPATLRAMKTGSSAVDIASPAGYLHSQLYYSTLPLLQIVMAINLGGSLLAREEQGGTLELLLARPISRGKLLAAKALSGAVLIVGAGLAYSLVTILLAKVVALDIPLWNLWWAGIYCTGLALCLGAIAFALSALGGFGARLATPVAAAVSLGGYLLATLSSLSKYLELPAKFLPYHYYNPLQVLQGQTLTGLNWYLGGLIVACVMVAWRGFRRRDIR